MLILLLIVLFGGSFFFFANLHPHRTGAITSASSLVCPSFYWS